MQKKKNDTRRSVTVYSCAGVRVRACACEEMCVEVSGLHVPT